MKIITRQILADTAPARFKLQYEKHRGSLNWRRVDHGVTIDQLEALARPINPDDVDQIIGNNSWTEVPKCHECGSYGFAAVVEVGENPDYESSTACLCIQCAKKAVSMLETT